MSLTTQRNGHILINEEAVRAGAGIMLVLGFWVFLGILYTFNIQLAFWIVLVFWLDFIVKTLGWVKLSPFLLLGELLVSWKEPLYVGIIQKRFAWSIGLIFSSIVLGFIVSRLFFSLSCEGVILCSTPFVLCGLCLIFMWLETSVGFCAGCHMYKKLKEKGYIKGASSDDQPCAGGVCSLRK